MHIVLYVKERNVAQPEDPPARFQVLPDGAFQRFVIIDRSRADAVRHDADGSICAITGGFSHPLAERRSLQNPETVCAQVTGDRLRVTDMAAIVGSIIEDYFLAQVTGPS